jgi:hypothetical protein
MRLPVLALILTSGLALAGDGPKPVTYMNGSVSGLSANTGATLEVTYAKGLIVRSASANVEIPYAAIVKTSRAPQQQVEEAKQPVYKVWTLRKKIIPPTPMENVTVAYRTNGTENNVTLLMEKKIADSVMEAWDRENERRSKARGEWWGDSYWKTAHNQGQWGGAGEVASREE